ncbi:hypothetical protein CampHawk_38 [Bacillus phage CampHawk]|uniref:Uncharacterized protein n=1 Tax=Bacillus phage CampHawk TaxID=1406783 RepID=U5PT28_9CAUD|nr:hypothetical protein CampHawk_38 [Bacillus phage CampHawk]AGY46916.1 hypothetical protein CampHawk_38 [Bacillus phage CampHawk]
MEIPIPRLRVVREFGEVKPVKDHSYVMVTDPWSTGRHTIHGPVPDLLMDDMWFELICIRKKMIRDIMGNMVITGGHTIYGDETQ